jgi:probable F420-dependent oxidoreductase
VKYWLSLLFEPVDQLIKHALMAEQLGFEGVVLPDHVVLQVGDKTPHPKGYPTEPHEDFVDPFCAFSAMAAVTTRLKFMNYVYVVPLRTPFAVAKQVASVARLSGNRMVLGTGVGWLKEEFAIVGEDFATRGARFDEALEIMRDFWEDGYAEYHGVHYDFPRSGMFPIPTEKVPIVIGGDSMKAARRAARYDGYVLMRAWVDAQTRSEFAEIDRIRAEESLDGSFEKIFMYLGRERAEVSQLEDEGFTAVVVPAWPMNDRSLTFEDKRAATEVLATTLF